MDAHWGFANKDLLIQYLLGDLSQSECRCLQKEYDAREDLREALCAAENDLIDSYVRGTLSSEQKRQFEGYFLDSPAKYERVETAKLLMNADLRSKVKTKVHLE